MSENIPDPIVAQTGYSAEAWVPDDFDEEALDLVEDDLDDELSIEEDRARGL